MTNCHLFECVLAFRDRVPATLVFTSTMLHVCGQTVMQAVSCSYALRSQQQQQQHKQQHQQHQQQLSNQQAAVVSRLGSGSSSSMPEPPDGRSSPGAAGPAGNSDLQASIADAMIVLREDLPLIFQRDQRFHIFRDDVSFRTPSMRCLTGLTKYRLLHRGVRWLGRLLFEDMRLSLTHMWQPEAQQQQLRVHWCVRGRSRLFGSELQNSGFISTYSFDSQGKIFEHQVDTLMPLEAPQLRLVELLVGMMQPQLPASAAAHAGAVERAAASSIHAGR